MTLRGIDVSHHQGVIDWLKVAASGVTFVFVKATEGTGYVDPRFAANVQGAHDAGLHVGAYHFAKPSSGDAEAEARWFLNITAHQPLSLPCVLDIEAGSGDLSSWALTFLTDVLEHTGIKPLLYTYGPFAREHLHDPRLAKFDLWLAAYSSKAVTPAPWQAWSIWQHSSSGKVPGISGRVDLNQTDSLIIGAPHAPVPLPEATVTVVPEDRVKRIDLAIDTDANGKGYRDIDAPALSVISVMVNTANPPDSGYKPIPDWARLDVNGKARIVVEEALPSGRIDLSVWVA